MNYALTVHPLSAAFQHRLEQALAARPTYLSLSDLRRRRPSEALGCLRALRGARLVLPLEDDHSRAILPVLTAIAAVSNADVTEVRYPDLRAEPLSRWSLASSVCALARASVTALVNAAACDHQLSGLLTAPRIAPRRDAGGPALYLNGNLWFGVKAGGSIGHVAGVVNAMRDRGIEVRYASAGGAPMIRPDVPRIVLQPPDVFGMPYELNYYVFHRRIAHQLRTLAAPRFLYQRMSIANYAGVVLSRRWGVPLVLEYNGSEAWIASNWGRPLRYHDLALKAENACLRHAHVVVTISDVLRDELVARGVDPQRIVTYPNCIDPRVFSPDRFTPDQSRQLRRTHGLPADAVVATFVGTFGQWHGADVLARAIRELCERHAQWLRRSKLRFVLVGDGLKMPLVREILGTACEPFVTLTGLVPQADAPVWLAMSDILLSPHVANADGSRFFGSPTKLFEYMAMARPIIASDLDQIGQVLRDSLHATSLPDGDPREDATPLAVLTPPGDVTGLVKSLMFLVDRPRWRSVLAGNARAEALSKYTWTHHVEAIVRAIDAHV